MAVFTNAGSNVIYLPGGVRIDALEAETIADAVYTANTQLREYVNRLVKQGTVTVTTPPAGYAVRTGRDGDPELALIGSARPGSIGVEFTVAAEAANAVLVTVQCVDEQGANIEGRQTLDVFISDDAEGDNLAVTAPTTLAGASKGHLIESISNKAGLLVTDVDGTAEVSVGDTGTDTWYLAVVLPDGNLVTSPAITLAA